MTDTNEPTERDRYVEALENKLRKAGKARRFLEGEDGSVVIEWATSQINALSKIVLGKQNLDNATENAYNIGQIHALQKLLHTINSDAKTDGAEIQAQIKAAKQDERPQS